MLQIGNKPIDTMYVGGKLVQQAYLGVKKIYPEHGVIPKAIKDAMVLWYDLAKQGATNESMATTPTLIDHSGNGHDATCYNFAWSGMSGIGGYLYDFMNWIFNGGLFVMERTSTSVHVDGRNEGVKTTTFLEKYLKRGEDTGTFTFPSLKIRVQNPNGFPICSDYWYNGLSTDVFDLSESGTYTIPERTFEVDESMSNKSIALRFRINTTKADAGTDYSKMNVTIELLPEYPGALVSDGVDDYCLVEGLPLLNKEDGYTVIAKRKHIYQDSINSPLLAKYMGADNNGAFQFERNVMNSTYYANSFGRATTITLSQEDIVYQTHDTYNGESIYVGDGEDTDYLNIFTRDRIGGMMCALYSLLLFNRDLTTEEIEWVKINLIETEQ